MGRTDRAARDRASRGATGLTPCLLVAALGLAGCAAQAAGAEIAADGTGITEEALATLHTRIEPNDAGELAFRTRLPAMASDCEAELPGPLLCADRDRDGLTDIWEWLAIRHLRPFVRLHDDEQFLQDPDGIMAHVARVTPADDGRIRVFIIIGFSRDYGSCGVSKHAGDSERVIYDLTPMSAGGSGDYRVNGFYAAAHEESPNDHGQLIWAEDFDDLEIVRDPVSRDARIRVYSSRDKHATYISPAACLNSGLQIAGLRVPCTQDFCDDGAETRVTERDLELPFVNAGEPEAPLVEDLEEIGFPGDDPFLDQAFCGGHDREGRCATSLLLRLTQDPFADEERILEYGKD